MPGTRMPEAVVSVSFDRMLLTIADRKFKFTHVKDDWQCRDCDLDEALCSPENSNSLPCLSMERRDRRCGVWKETKP